MTFDPGESLVRVVVSLLNQPELLSLTLVESALHTVGFLQSLQSQDQQLSVVFVGEGREGYGRKPPRLQPMDRGGVDSHGLLGADVWPVLEVIVLPLLLGLQV